MISRVTSTILDQILEHKREEVSSLKQMFPLANVREAAVAATSDKDFLAALRHPPGDGPALIAEVKRASPSRGLLVQDFNPVNLARLYKANGASSVSILTDERFFKGSLDDLQAVANDEGVGLPLLCKEFVFDPYQVYRARLAGADALLLIAACLDVSQLSDLMALCRELGMEPLVEVHNLDELEVALKCEPALLGVNNRDLHDFSVDLETTIAMRPDIPEDILLVSESGIRSAEHVERLATAGVDAILVGEALVTAPDIAAKVRELACCG